MRLVTTRLVTLGSFAFAAMLAACQGNLGSGSGLSLPATPPYNQPGGPGGAAAPQSRQRALDGAVYVTADMNEIPLPALNGYGVTLALGTPSPTPSPSPVATTAPSRGPAGRARRTRTRAGVRPQGSVALVAPSAAPSPAAAGSAPSTGLQTASPGAASASAGPNAFGASASASSSAAPLPSGATPRPPPATTGSPGVSKTATKTTVFPDDAPAAPSPQPSGNVQTFAVRKAIVRGFIQPGSAISLYGLGAVRFTIPTAEQTAGRGFTVAVYTVGRRHHATLVTADPAPVLAKDVVASTHADPLVLKKGVGYLLMLYGDELPATPGPVPSGYASPGNNPFVTPYPTGSYGGTAPGAGIGPHGSGMMTPSGPASQTPAP